MPIHRPLDIQGVADETLTCLTCWPDGTVGEQRELQAIRIINHLCKELGYGRVPQIAAQIEDLWRNPEKHAGYVQQRQNHLDLVESTRRAHENNKKRKR